MPVFMREHSNFWYSIRAYYFAKTTADIPFQIALPAVYGTIVYFMTGQPSGDFHRLGIFNLMLILASLVGQSTGILMVHCFLCN